MTREFKFRVWDFINQKMYDEPWFESDGGSMLFNDIIKHAHEQHVLQQFTGLKDKNGKEVFENDIVKCSAGCLHVLIWEEVGAWSFGMPRWYLDGLDDGYSWTGEEEVIGNIYENPELITR